MKRRRRRIKRTISFFGERANPSSQIKVEYMTVQCELRNNLD
jgi:hypothetical protein